MADSPWASVGAQTVPSRPGSDYTGTADGLVDLTLQVRSLRLTWSWGAQPAPAEVTYVGNVPTPSGSVLDAVSPVLDGSYVRLEVGQGAAAHTFHGVAVNSQPVDASSGKEWKFEFADLRHYLAYDQVFGAFNLPDSQLVAVGGGLYERRRRWRHLLPANWAAGLWTWTDEEYTAQGIANLILAAATVGSPWLYYGPEYHPVMATEPVRGLDWTNGVRLDQALLALSDPLGLVFTLAGFYKLRWRRKGEILAGVDASQPWAASPFPVTGDGDYYNLANVFVWPAGADQCRPGRALSGTPTRAFVVGDRNLRQVLDLELVKDWAAGWEAWFSFEDHVFQWVYEHVFYDPAGFPDKTYADYPDDHPGDPENLVGNQLCLLRCQRMTLREWCALREQVESDGADFADYRKFSGQARMDMPVALYLSQVLWRAYRLPDTVLGRPATSYAIEDRALVAVTHSEAGVMAADFVTPADGNGYAIARGYAIGQESFRALSPGRFSLSEWVDAQLEWAPVSFSIDNGSGDQVPFIVLERPVFDGSDAYAEIAAALPAAQVVPRARPELTAVAVRAALTLAGERYTYEHTNGSGSLDTTVAEPALRWEKVLRADGTALGEIAYADGQTPDTKAIALALAVLPGRSSVRAGGFRRALAPGDLGVRINGMIDRLSLEVSPTGIFEHVEFTSEWKSGAFEPERQYDRRVRQAALFPGQAELLAASRQTAALASALRRNPWARQTLARAFADHLGMPPAWHPVSVAAPAGGWLGATLPVGTPLWSLPATAVAAAPAETTEDSTVFQGVTARDGEVPVMPLRTVVTGRALARVTGPVAVGDGVGLNPGEDSLIGGAARRCGEALAAVPDGETKLIWVQLGGGGSGAPGDWD